MLHNTLIHPEWPVYFKNILRVGDINSNVGVVTLWTERDVIQNTLTKKDYAAVGNLYAAAGINHMLRNIFANPMIRYLLIWGADMSQSGHSLLKFIQNGIDDNYQIVGGRGEIEKEIPKKAIELFRKNVKVIDLRGKPISQIKETIRKLPKEKPFLPKYKLFPPSKTKVDNWPSEDAGFRVEGDTVAQTWLKVLNLITRYGKTEKTRYASNNRLKEILNLTAIINKEDPDKEYFPHYLPFSFSELKAYYPEMLTKRRISGTAYNYGDRMRNQPSFAKASEGKSASSENKEIRIDQINEIIDLLKRRPFSKKAFAVLYRVDDWKNVNRSDTPCMTQLQAKITQNKLYLTAYFRSQDMFHGWPRNAFALRKVQNEIAKGVGIKLGALSIITMSAHMYADDWKTAENVLKDNFLQKLKYPLRFPHFHPDPRGNWLIDVVYETVFATDPFFTAPLYTYALHPLKVGPLKGVKKGQPLRTQGLPLRGKIIAKLYPDEKMQAPILTIEGRTAKEVYWQIADWERMSMPSHIFSIGEELTKAEIALRLGLEFKMDSPLDIRKKIKRSTR